MSRGFHESYYDHACRVISERDILDRNIGDVTLFKAIKKKWNDLFLLSYSDTRAGDLYHSTHAMRLGRSHHYLMHRGSIHPLSKFRNFWDMFILHVFIMHQLFVYLNTTLLLRSVPVLTTYIGMMLEVFMIFDIIINSRTGFIDKFNRSVELDKRLILRNYCSKKLFFHTASAIPLVFIMFLRYGNEIGCTLYKANYFNCVISFLTIINLLRVYELSSYWERDRTSFTSTVICDVLRIGVNVTLIATQLVHSSDTLSLIHVMKTETKSAVIHNISSINSYFDELFMLIHTNNTGTKIINDMTFVYVHFWRIVTFLGRPRFGIIHDDDDDNDDVIQYYALIYPHPLLNFIAYGITFFITSWLIMKIFYLISRASYLDDEIHNSETYLLNLVKRRQLPEQLNSMIKEYVHFPAAKIKMIENTIKKSLPNSLNEEIAWHGFSRFVMRIPYFSGWPREILKKIVYLVEELIFLENTVVVESGVASQGLMIVDSGVLAVYKMHNGNHFGTKPFYDEVEHLIDGDYFGQLSLVTERAISTTTIVAITTCKILFVEKTLFKHLMRNNRDLFYSMQEEVQNEITKLTDEIVE
ncbi:potassium/sodium hyperpolarization-activated cyclic nucleotide-gated channel 4-like isoform X1 [Plodia interpunctella]|uniref:potassium/sodium hyperpolarization-activated cyclic nucleotide-gated channel 4-like isoform X1 n=1 Tax=Plodia interpunctella TaxID=58824 RepID=UPI0023674E13|nr:potassium/sodium hyperpolarization-activated cyclic nucleotide-gated channel 4-like isoform X1 [Plodia interpunctella]